MSTTSRALFTTIYHRKSAATEGRSVLARAIFVLGILTVATWFMVGGKDRLFAVAFIGIVAVVCGIALCYGVLNVRIGGTFECRLDDDAIMCRCPLKWAGESFSVRLSDIVKLEHEARDDGEVRWYIWDRFGRRHWLTSNYDNPVDAFAQGLRERIPTLLQVRTVNWERKSTVMGKFAK